jgi:hypothetical protein
MGRIPQGNSGQGGGAKLRGGCFGMTVAAALLAALIGWLL